jgi:CRP/FNR family cyclic AMP-dependent transcriptional regulator
VAALRALALMAAAPESDLARLAEDTTVRLVAAGETILDAAWNEDVVLLVRGRAMATAPAGEAGRVSTGFHEAGDVLALGRRAHGSAADALRVIAVGPALALHLPTGSFRRFLQRNPSICLALVDALDARLQHTLDLVAAHAGLGVGDRLYRLLTELVAKGAARLSPRVEGGPAARLVVEVGMGQAELAVVVGASREAVNRCLAQWKARGLLLVPARGELHVPNPRALTQAVSAAVRCEAFAATLD